MQQTHSHTPFPTTPVSAMQAIVGWIVATDRRFRATQNRINRMGRDF